MSIEVSDTKIDLSIDAVLHSYKGDGTLLETTENVDWTMSGNEKSKPFSRPIVQCIERSVCTRAKPVKWP